MFRIVRSKTERLLRETLAERERVVQLLVEEVQFLRAQFGLPTTTVQRAAQGEPPIPTVDFTDGMEIEVRQVPTEEMEQLDAMFQAKVISHEEYLEAKQKLQDGVTTDDIIE